MILWQRECNSLERKLGRCLCSLRSMTSSLNVTNYTSSIKALKPFKMPYRCGADFRLKVRDYLLSCDSTDNVHCRGVGQALDGTLG